MENLREYYCLAIILSINSFSEPSVTVNKEYTKYYHNQALKKKIKLIRGTITFFKKIVKPFVPFLLYT